MLVATVHGKVSSTVEHHIKRFTDLKVPVAIFPNRSASKENK